MWQLKDISATSWLPNLFTHILTTLILLSWYCHLGVRATSSVAASITSSATSSSRQYDQNKNNRVLADEYMTTDHSSEDDDQGSSASNFLFPNANDESYWREIKAIIGGVLGFWGGVGGLGTLFLVVVLSQRYCCRKSDEEKDGDGWCYWV